MVVTPHKNDCRWWLHLTKMTVDGGYTSRKMTVDGGYTSRKMTVDGGYTSQK